METYKQLIALRREIERRNTGGALASKMAEYRATCAGIGYVQIGGLKVLNLPDRIEEVTRKVAGIEKPPRVAKRAPRSAPTWGSFHALVESGNREEAAGLGLPLAFFLWDDGSVEVATNAAPLIWGPDGRPAFVGRINQLWGIVDVGTGKAIRGAIYKTKSSALAALAAIPADKMAQVSHYVAGFEQYGQELLRELWIHGPR